MPFNPDDIPKDLRKAVRTGSVVPLVGAGLSKIASTDFPTWVELIDKLLDRARDDKYIQTDAECDEVRSLYQAGDSLLAAQHLQERFPQDAYVRVLEDMFTLQVDPSDAHDQLLDLRPSLIVTTNYDKLIEDACARRFKKAPTVFTYQNSDAMQRSMQPGSLTRDEPRIFKIHGSVADPGGIILTERDYRKLLFAQPGYRLVLSALFLTQVILMIGFSADDPELRLLLASHREALKDSSSTDYAFMAIDRNGVKAQRLRHDFGIQVIPYEPDDPTHPEIGEFLAELAAEAQIDQPEDAP
jgi:hypothetical protein